MSATISPQLPVHHVYPRGDIREHVTDGGLCWCNPVLERVYRPPSKVCCGIIVVHHAADQRKQQFGGWTAN